MLSGVLKNDIAIDVSINIMRAFIEMRKFINSNKNLFEKEVYSYYLQIKVGLG